MGIRREEEMEMSDDDMEDAPDSKDSEDSGRDLSALALSARPCQRDRRLSCLRSSGGGAVRALSLHETGSPSLPEQEKVLRLDA